jgi:HK97 gp10 family phage protein
LATSFSWDVSKFKSVKVMETKLQRAIYGVCKYWDGPVERYMKHNAPWKDRTTNARNGLSATAQKSGSRILSSTFAIILSHSVDYGIYLERGTRNMRARPIIEPTIKIYAPKVLKTLTKILDRLGSA